MTLVKRSAELVKEINHFIAKQKEKSDHQAFLISQQTAEIEKLKNALSKATQLLDKYEDILNQGESP